MKDEKSKTLYIIMYAMLGLIVIGFIIFAIQVWGMIDDHNCWVDGYHDEHCLKYVRGNE